MDTAKKYGLTGNTTTRENGGKERNMGQVKNYRQMDRSTKENTLIIIKMELDLRFGKMVPLMKESLKRMSSMEKENIYGRMDDPT